MPVHRHLHCLRAGSADHPERDPFTLKLLEHSAPDLHPFPQFGGIADEDVVDQKGVEGDGLSVQRVHDIARLQTLPDHCDRPFPASPIQRHTCSGGAMVPEKT